jgi:phage terminase large subunit-like protein
MSFCRVERECAAGAALGVRVLGAAAPVAASGRLEDLGHHGWTRRGQDARRGRNGCGAGGRAATPDAGRARRVALVGETVDQVRDVMVLGESGIIWPVRRRTGGRSGRRRNRRLVWPNGAVAQVFSAHEPEALRGPQFDAAWADELGKWKKGGEAWDQLQFALRLGGTRRQVVTTTPRNVGVLKAILKNPSTVVTHAPTEANRAYLAESFLAEVQARYGGTRLGRQELEGVLVDEAEGALWTAEMLEAARVDRCRCSTGWWWRWILRSRR